MVAPDVFDSAAKALGFTLDRAQRHAAIELATTAHGLYLWGPVGRGKSWLMEIYFDALSTERKLRVHFHEFFRDLHRAVRRNHHDLSAALDELLDGVDVVCFDEFHVHDPADGKFIARLLTHLFGRDIRVILTSNYPPRSLLPNPLFHDGFIPTIELIEQNLTVLAVDGPLDYRTVSGHEAGFAAGWWVVQESRRLAQLGLVPPRLDEHRTVSPAGHPLHLQRATDDGLWADFTDLCVATTVPADYLALADHFRHWVISGVPDLRTAGREPAQRFANVVDVLYDRDITTVFIANVPLSALPCDARLPHDIERIMSRLVTVRRAHRPRQRRLP
ncbi:MAG TPA: cell division protein ZapE [Rhodococcus sp. (in: high G+C Gram-positive bacteria)]|nr:cell division protein ZapE [Rhodococcus sp. (in: high G+C Gram-positive bacteria)]